MRWVRILLITVGVISLLLNMVFAGIATRVFLRSERGAFSGIVMALPDDVRRDIIREIRRDQGSFREAQKAVQQSRLRLQTLLQKDQAEREEFEEVLSELRRNTEKLQIELHMFFLETYYGKEPDHKSAD